MITIRTKFPYRIAGALAALVFVAGCATTQSAPVRPEPVADALPAFDAERDPAAVADEYAEVEQAEEAARAPADGAHPGSRVGTGSFINQQSAAKAPSVNTATGDVMLNFEGESLHAVIKLILGDFLQQNYVVAPGVQGTVTFSTAKPLRGDQALSILEMLLRWNNATLVWQDGRYTVLPVAQALPGNLTPRTGPAQNARGFEVRAVPLQFISALEMEKVLKPYAKPEAVVSVDPARNMIVLAGTRDELENYLQTVEVFDVDWLSGMSVGVFPLQQAEASKVVAELEKIFGEGSNTPLAGMFRFIPLEGINGILVITPQPKYLTTIGEWMERFDLGTGDAGTRLYVYDVKNVKATDLAATLGEVFGGGGGSTSRGGGVAPGLDPVRIDTFTSGGGINTTTGSGQKSGDVNQKSLDKQMAVEQPVPVPPPATAVALQATPGAATAAVGTPDASGGLTVAAGDDVRISAIEDSNALIVRASASQWESIRRVIERLDTVPLQVVIEAQIISVQLTDQLNYGVRWFFENAIGAENSGLPASALQLSRDRHIWGDIAGSITGSTTSWSLVGPNIGAVVNLLDSVTNLRVLSAPSLVVLNNKEASINSGSSVPISTTSILPGTGTNQQFSSTQYLQTGITLNVTPRVNPGGLVFLEIDQEDSTPGDVPAGSPPGTNPPIAQSKIQTEIAVQSGDTVLLGGLIKQSDTKGSSGVPGLSRIPIVGGLFGSKNNNSTRQELLVLITPKVISNSDEARAITEEYKTKFRGLEPLRHGMPQGSR